MEYNQKCYWRFKGEKAYRIGYPARESNGLVRMAHYIGAPRGGPIVDLKDIEIKGR
ncbi:hypothetical protein LCGC14_2582400 [marine sediment metagenome]|uniref:Uncharacterized protein n=1 Tax=marine sediment metagenome TaxID=412755 RepID=A0A0F9D6U1_9ZZZZ